MNQLVEKIKSALKLYRLTFGSEVELQDQLAEIFAAAGLAYEREFNLSTEDRPDFFMKPFCIEVKTKGALHGHLAQIQRYNRHQSVAGTILICTKPVGALMPETLAGKPVAAICVGGNRL